MLHTVKKKAYFLFNHKYITYPYNIIVTQKLHNF